jgi:hypothetical protein
VSLISDEDAHNVRQILLHHMGHPSARDDNGERISPVAEHDYAALEHDLLRYCYRLRCQPRTPAQVDLQGYHVPAHRLVSWQ